MTLNKFKLLQIQNKLQPSKLATLQHIENLVQQNSYATPDIIMLPEMFNCPYDTKLFPAYAEPYQGQSYTFARELAKKYNVYLIAGSLPEIDENGNIFNVSYVFDNQGNEIACHRKVHMFDINISSGQSFKESDILTPGDKITVFDTPWGKMGLCICYDFRFPELTRLMAERGAKVVFVPASFNFTTGPLHWELIFRSRAVDNQIYTVGTAPALDTSASYHSWGHSIVVSPWGVVLNSLDEQEGLLLTDIDLQDVEDIRRQLPLLKSRRLDIYRLIDVKKEAMEQEKRTINPEEVDIEIDIETEKQPKASKKKKK